MYIETVPNRGSRPAYLLREAKRDGKKVVKRTIANLSSLPDAAIETLRVCLRGGTLCDASEQTSVLSTIPAGHVMAIEAAMSRLGMAGYDSAQVSGIKAEVSASELRKIMLDSGVTPIGAHIGIEKWRGENFIQTVAYCHDLGVEYAAIPGVNFKVCMQWGLAKWKKQIREFEAIAKRALKEGIHLQYHNHDLEFSQLGIKGGRGGRNILEMVFDSTTVLQGEPDFGWVMRGGMDPALWAKRLKGRIDQVHLKDWSLIGGEFHMRALGEGRIDWPRVIRECQKGGTHTFIVEQDECPATNDPFRSLAISREYLRRIMGA